ncbi:MAG: heparinase II/III domain-containing protein [Myxococcota bacterium]
MLGLAALVLAAPGARAAWVPPDGVDLTRPRILFRPGQLADVQAVLDMDPLPPTIATVLDAMEQRIAAAEGVPLDDHEKGRERQKARAAKDLAFLYAVDRTWAAGQVVPFPDAAARKAAGDRVRELLLNMYTVSRIGDFGPWGGWDRDITTSEEIIMYTTAYDALAGAGYDFEGDEAAIVENLVDLTSGLYLDYTVPETALTFPELHQNNHRSKVGASFVVAALALAEHTPAPGSDPNGVRDPALWLPYGLDLVDKIIRHALMTGDGAYAEGPFYWRYSSQNLLPFARAWHNAVGDVDWPTSDGFSVPSFWTHPLFLRSHRWMLDMTFPDGSLVHIDDGNPTRSHFFGAAPALPRDAAAFAWRFANAPTPYDTDGNIDMGPDVIASFDPSLVPAPPTTPPTVFYEEGGNAILKSSWENDAVMAVVLAEADTASELGTDRYGAPVVPESHEHPDPGSFILHAFGQRLAIDPGYLSFGEHDAVNKPQHHNIILVDGSGPVEILGASLAWGADPTPRPPADGHARMSDPLDGDFLDAVRVTSSYGKGYEGYTTAPRIERRFLFPDHRYLVAADAVDSRDAEAHDFTWLIHGNGGGAAEDGGAVDGTFALTPPGGRWTRSVARLDGAVAVADAIPTVETGLEVHEEQYGRALTHVVLKTTARGESLRSLMLAYPSRSADAAPSISQPDIAGAAALSLDDPAGDRRVLAWHRAATGAALQVPSAASGLATAESDGHLALFDATSDGRLRLAWSEGATRLAYDGVTYFDRALPGRIGIALSPGRADGVAEGGSGEVDVHGLDFTPATAHGACALSTLAGQPPRVRLGRDRRFSLEAAAGNARPAADPGPDQHLVLPGTQLELDGTASCDADGDALTPRWELVSAPARGAWTLSDTSSWHPRLTVDQPGPYRVSLVVTDIHGARSRPVEVRIVAGAPCGDGVDADRDGWIDGDDSGCSEGLGITESPVCANGEDDDGDGLTDWPDDPECVKPYGHSERFVYCGLGAELAGALAGILAWRRCRRVHSS